ncbi:MAG: class I SAM-dependent methyltransferase [Pseudohongiella sp.]
MASKAVLDYFDATEGRETRADLKQAVRLVEGPRVAIDCGCGAGSDIAFLRENDFVVHAFDIEQEAVARCQKRFNGDSSVTVSCDSFNSFEYPRASLVVADASLFFCPEKEFHEVWGKIAQSLYPDGVFVGSFLGPEATMAGPDYDRAAFWPDVLVATEDNVRSWLEGFRIVSFTEHRTSGTTVNGTPHNWHIFAVVAVKNPAKVFVR